MPPDRLYPMYLLVQTVDGSLVFSELGTEDVAISLEEPFRSQFRTWDNLSHTADYTSLAGCLIFRLNG
jgi:hypothetical protein